MRDLPKGWVETTLGEISQDCVDQSGPDECEATFTYVDISAIDRATKQIENPQTLDPKKHPSRARQRLVAGDVLVSMTRPNLNAVALVPKGLDGSIGSTGFLILRSRFMSQRWLGYRVQAQDFVSAMSMKVQGALYPAVRPKDIAEYPVAVPPSKEQDRVVDEIEKQFTRLDAATTALKRVQSNLKRYRASVLKAACEGRLVPTEAELARKEGRDYEPADKLLLRILRERRARWEADTVAKMQASGKPPKDDHWKQKYKESSAPDTSNLPELPDGWCWASVEQLGFVQLGRQRSPQNRSRDYPTPYLRAASITEAGIDLSDVLEMEFNPAERERFALQQGDLILSEASGSPDQVGKPAIWRNELPLCCFQNTVLRLQLANIESEYLLVVFMHYYRNGEFTRTAGGVGINHLSAGKFASMAVPLAPADEQTRIIQAVQRSVSVADNLMAQVAIDEARKDSLRRVILQQAFTGQLVPQDPTDEPASVLLERIRAERVESSKKTARKACSKRGER